ncbi:alkaline phosphatase [Chlorogloeopsis fritschii PCC 6912]|uniref:Alkaline phosphatase n=1 Tax=Chlorogloeopsis fritschii PCC 6912 TaxID=211165 RepID=A0A433NHC5_CHLFR|nr:choice-of-anchor I family protein [Chlorogloeopsis fritschii]RUR81719.1 alkaline phosphatase [Chlorogloeopsis fritschii PCC 6912]
MTINIKKLIGLVALSAALLVALATPVNAVLLKPIGTYSTGLFDAGAAEIPTYDPKTQRLFVVNGASNSIDVISIKEPTNPSLVSAIDISRFGSSVNSVAFNNGILAAAIDADNPQDPGKVVFFDANGEFIQSVTVGAIPDMLTFTPDGTRVLVANEGEPNQNYDVDPEGSVSIINLLGSSPGKKPAAVVQGQILNHNADIARRFNPSVVNVSFTKFNSQIDKLRAAGVRIFGPNATVAQDLEPEYITVADDGNKAWVVLQENNAIAVLDLINNEFTDIIPLGFQDHSLGENALDVSDRDSVINIANWPILGMYQPDGITSYKVRGKTYIVTANEGDARDYDAFSEEVRSGNNRYQLDSNVFPNATELKRPENLGRLTVTNTLGDVNGDGRFEQIYSFGSRSFSIWEWDEANNKLSRVYDSGSEFERITAQRFPNFFNSNHVENSFDTRSDDKGPEPEDVKIARINGRFYAFIGLERISGVMIYDVSDPHKPVFVNYFNNRNFNVPTNFGDQTNPAVGDLGAEGLLFIPATDSPNRQPLLVVANEVSGTTTLFSIDIPRGRRSFNQPGLIFGIIAFGSMGIWKFKRQR